MSPDSVLHMLHRVLKRTGLPRVRFQDLRHTFAALVQKNVVDIKTVSSMLGYFSAGFPLDTYARSCDRGRPATGSTDHGECALRQSLTLSEMLQLFPLEFPVWVGVWVKLQAKKWTRQKSNEK